MLKKIHIPKKASLVTLLTVIFLFSLMNCFGFSKSTNLVLAAEDQFPNNTVEPNTGAYNAELHWVKTNITLDSEGSGKVSMIINCTPTEDHFGIYIRPIEELSTIIADESYAITEGEILDINYTTSNRFDISYYIYIQNTSEIQAGKSLLYHINYNADFFSADLVSHYDVNTDLVSINFNRPYWDEVLEYETLKIQLPVEVEGSTISQSFLDNILFEVGLQMNTYYNLSYTGREDSFGTYWLVFEVEKQNIPALGAFEATFYLSINYFNLPKVINWFVMTFIFIFSLISLSLFIVVINLKNRSKKEIDEFKEGLKEVLKEEKE